MRQLAIPFQHRLQLTTGSETMDHLEYETTTKSDPYSPERCHICTPQVVQQCDEDSYDDDKGQHDEGFPAAYFFQHAIMCCQDEQVDQHDHCAGNRSDTVQIEQQGEEQTQRHGYILPESVT